jgi:hypothetical protein
VDCAAVARGGAGATGTWRLAELYPRPGLPNLSTSFSWCHRQTPGGNPTLKPHALIIPLPLLLAPLVFPSSAHPQWSPTGASLCDPECRADLPYIAPDGVGGAYIAWRDQRANTGSNTDIYVQRVTSSGVIASGWPAGGFPVCVNPESQTPVSIASDGEGGVLITWTDQRDGPTTNTDIYAQRVRPDGTLPPGWPVDGAVVTRALYAQSIPSIVSDGAGGAFVVWQDVRELDETVPNIYAQHLDANGVAASGWLPDGLPVCTDPKIQTGPFLMTDGADGMVAAWMDFRNRPPAFGVEPDIYAVRLTSSGAVAPGWTSNGKPIMLNRAFRHRVNLAPDGAGGFYVAGSTLNDMAGDEEYWVQRIDFDGTPAVGWPSNGIRVCAASNDRDGLRIAADGLGGLLLTWHDYRFGSGEIFALRVLADGSLAPGWTVDGVLVSHEIDAFNGFAPQIAADGTGGAYVSWEAQRTVSTAMIQYLTASGAVAPGWPQYGTPVSTTASQLDQQLSADEFGGAIVAWSERANGRFGVYAQRFNTNGPVATLISLVGATAQPSGVDLTWFGTSSAGTLEGMVQRRVINGPWQVLGRATPDGPEQLRYRDETVVPGERYGYRLAYVDDGIERFTEEAWVTVPNALALAVEGFRPNPAVGQPAVALTLADPVAARLEVIDVTGRRLIERAVPPIPGRHHIRLAGTSQLQPGMYVVRVTQGMRSAQARGIVLR